VNAATLTESYQYLPDYGEYGVSLLFRLVMAKPGERRWICRKNILRNSIDRSSNAMGAAADCQARQQGADASASTCAGSVAAGIIASYTTYNSRRVRDERKRRIAERDGDTLLLVTP
jgi:hypothetical protein